MKLEIKRFSGQTIYCFSILLVMATLIVFYGMEKVLIGLRGDGMGTQIMTHLITIVFLIVIWRKVVPFIPLRLGKKGLMKGILLGWIMIIMSALNVNYPAFIKYGVIIPHPFKVISFLIWMFFIGIFEEFFIRGLVLENMLRKWGSTKKGIYKAAVFSSILFGIAHICNLIETPQLIIATLTQVFYAIFIGIFFAGVYIRSRNLGSVIIYHTMFDMAHFLSEVFVPLEVMTSAVTITDMTFGAACVNLCLNSVFLISGLWLLRKAEPFYKEGKPIL